MKSKKCSKCDQVKSYKKFHKHKNNPDGYAYGCKECRKKYRKENKSDIEKKRAEYLKRPEVQQRRKERRKEYYENNKEKELKRNREYYRKNRKSEIQRVNEYQIQRRKEDEEFRLICNLRGRIKKVISRNDRSKSTKKLLGCSINKFKQHLEDQFQEGMTWDNYGEWHIDHVIPCNMFDQTCEYQRAVCWHYTNMQPLWAEDNISKSDKIPNLLNNISIDK